MTERTAVQDPMLRYASDIGWSYVPTTEATALRQGESGLFFNEILLERLQRLNPGIVDEARAAAIVRQLSLLRSDITGNRDLLAWLRGEQSVFVPEERRERNVRLADFDSPEENVYQVTEEWTHRNPRCANRADIVFLINGIPVAICETKNAGRQDGLAMGIDQVRRYHRESPEMLIAPQTFEVSQLLDFYYGATWSTSRKNLFNWRQDRSNPPDRAEEVWNYENAVKSFFDRRRFLKVLRDYIIFLTKDDELSKIILRQHQTRAVEKVIERVYDGRKRRGLVWHTQGSGKTLTMITIASRLLRDARGGAKPTVVMLVDRNELEAQLFRNIAAYGLTTVQVAHSKEDLRRILRSDYRGLVVSMIHKFDGADANLCPRSDVVVLVDEAHRTTGGDLGNYLVAALPDAVYIGFTGTPIDRLASGRGTFKVFGIDDPQGYLDKYSIAESIADGTTVPLNYALAPSELRVDRETLDREFLDLRESEGVSDQAELDAVLSRAVQLKEMMKSPPRVDHIARFVAEHYLANVEPMGLKAFVVAVDREACALYKDALDRYLPKEYSRVVYSAGVNDGEVLKRHYLTDEQEKQVRKDFIRQGALPKLLIVTEKLLTGFDAPILYSMYLDKPMRDHVLLQAIARVNRPYEDEGGQVKPYGFVLDFVGIFENMQKALSFDSDVVASVIRNLDVLRALFARMMAEQSPAYLPLTLGMDDKAKERAVIAMQDREKREAFFTFFRQLQSIYDILSPDVFLRPFIEDYSALAVLYGWVRRAYSDRVMVDREFTRKTKELLQQHTKSGVLEPPAVIYEIGQQQLRALRESSAAETVKVLNLRKLLAELVEEEGAARPYLLSIGERAQTVAQAYEDRQIDTKEALRCFEVLVEETVAAEDRRRSLDLDGNAFAIYAELTALVPETTPAQAQAVDALFGRFPDYRWNTQRQSALRSELYRVLLPIVGTARMVAAANALLRLERA